MSRGRFPHHANHTRSKADWDYHSLKEVRIGASGPEVMVIRIDDIPTPRFDIRQEVWHKASGDKYTVISLPWTHCGNTIVSCVKDSGPSYAFRLNDLTDVEPCPEVTMTIRTKSPDAVRQALATLKNVEVDG